MLLHVLFISLSYPEGEWIKEFKPSPHESSEFF